MDRLEVFKIIALQASKGELTFPANVKATLKLQEALDDPDCHIEAAARMVMAEPLLSARVVALANSAAYNRSGNEIANVRAAVSRLGFATLKSMVASVIVRQLGSQITDPQLRAKRGQAVGAHGPRGRAEPGHRAQSHACGRGNGHVRRHRARGGRLFICCRAPRNIRACSTTTRKTGSNTAKN